MSGRRNCFVTFGFVLAVSLIAAAVSAAAVSYHYSRLQFELLNVICKEVAEREPEAKKIIAAVLKEYKEGDAGESAEDDFLSGLGYRIYDIAGTAYGNNILFAAAGFLTGVLLFGITFYYRNKTEAMRIRALADYLEQVNTGRAAILSVPGEDDFSKLEDEIYKTVTYLYQTKETAVRAKNDFAGSLSNIAHQIKTPITAISLSVQMMKQNIAEKRTICSRSCGAEDFRSQICDFYTIHLQQAEKQILRLTHLEESLLLLSRIDAGTLPLQKNQTDVFTILVLAADNLQELLESYKVSIDIPELGERMVTADLEWTMEAVMNLMKNCMEHNRGGTIHCSYAQNPLYTEILIWDDGEGFRKEDLPHLFERFYRGRNAKESGIGIGLALSKEIIERQNGTIRAKNRPKGGACFEIRFYSH